MRLAWFNLARYSNREAFMRKNTGTAPAPTQPAPKAKAPKLLPCDTDVRAVMREHDAVLRALAGR